LDQFAQNFFSLIAPSLSVVAAWAALLTLLFKFSADSEFETQVSLYIQGDYQKNWPKLFGAFLEKLFGKNLFGWSTFLRASVASLICATLIAFLYSATGLFSRIENSPTVLQFIAMALSINLIADNIALAQTRYVLSLAENFDSVFIHLLLLILDLILTAVIIFLAINAYTFVTAQKFIHVAYIVGFLTEYSIFFYSTFLTSVWAWIYFSSSWLVHVFLRPIFRFFINYKKHPFLAFTFITSIFVGVIAFIFQLMPLEKIDEGLCEFFGGDVCLKVEGLTEDEIRTYTYLTRYCREDIDEFCIFKTANGREFIPSKIKSIFGTACDADHLEACGMAGMFYSNNYGNAAPDYPRGNIYYEKSCSNNLWFGCHMLGNAYRDGIGIDQSHTEARTYYSKSCDFGNSGGCNELAKLYVAGLGGKQNVSKARRLYQIGCKNLDSESCYEYGVMLETGVGGKKDLPTAKEAFAVACKAHRVNACDRPK